MAFAIPARIQTRRRNAQAAQGRSHGFGAALRQHLVGGVTAHAVGVALDQDAALGVLLQIARKFAQRVLGTWLDFSTAKFKQHVTQCDEHAAVGLPGLQLGQLGLQRSSLHLRRAGTGLGRCRLLSCGLGTRLSVAGLHARSIGPCISGCSFGFGIGRVGLCVGCLRLRTPRFGCACIGSRPFAVGVSAFDAFFVGLRSRHGNCRFGQAAGHIGATCDDAQALAFVIQRIGLIEFVSGPFQLERGVLRYTAVVFGGTDGVACCEQFGRRWF